MFKDVSSHVDFVEQEHEILRFWEKTKAFDRLVQLRAEGPRWSFIDGPITANNPMGVHHGWGRTYKDLFHRYNAMKGYRTRYQNGFDCQGLWVEVNVEREMGFTSKRDIEEFGLARFVQLCKQRVLKYAAVQTEQSKRLGYWMDWDDPALLHMLREKLAEDPTQQITIEGPNGPVTDSVEAIVGHLGMPELGGSYYTFSDENNYTIWSVLKSCHERGWIYKGRDVMPWCFRCGTGLSQHEIVTEGYQELTHPGVTLRFPLRDRPGESLLVWTTTPWTLTSNVAAAVGPDLTYARIRQGEQVYFLSKGTLHMVEGDYELEDELLGEAMEGWAYHGPFDGLPAQRGALASEEHRVILWEEVGEDEGTGIVHIAPGCGAEDFALSKEFDLAVIAPLSEDGVFVDGFQDLSGMHVSDVTQPIFESLRKKDLLYKIEDYTHRYPVCWRCGEELVFRLVDEWFISMGEKLDVPYEQVTEEQKLQNLRYQIMEVVAQETNWFPSFGKERELDWLRNMEDWMISKKRYWGLALPIWVCGDCGHFNVIGSKQELQERAIEGWEVFQGHSPHRPTIDAVVVACERCGGNMRRIPDVGNPWLDAGIVGMSTLRYNSDRDYWRKWFPANLISESFPGQFRNWFYSLLTMSTILERKAPFNDVFTYATLLAEDGRAMHKSWGNMIEFNEAADEMGVDVMRWLYCNHKPEKDLLFGYHRADDARRQFLIPLWNVYSFFVTYANIDGWQPGDDQTLTYTELDRWILSRLNQLIQEVGNRLEAYEPDGATEAVNRFLDDLSNWYLRRSRRRFWAKAGVGESADADKNAAYATLYQTLVTLSKVLAPFVPFVTEAMYQNLVRSQDDETPESIHHCFWPEIQTEQLDQELMQEMDLVKSLVSLGHAARNLARRKLRQPLAEAAFFVGSADADEVVKKYADLVRDELNVKDVRLLSTVDEVLDYELKPLPMQLGQKYQDRFPSIREAIQSLPSAETQEKAMALLSGVESFTLNLDGESIEILADEVDVVIEAHEGFSAVADGSLVAALQTDLTPELELEGLAREVVRRIQDLRKQADFEVDDRIEVEFHASRHLQDAIEANRDYIQGETLADELIHSEKPRGDQSAGHHFDGQDLTISVRKVAVS
jgi:isoleucyl-tRNA synthetase